MTVAPPGRGGSRPRDHPRSRSRAAARADIARTRAGSAAGTGSRAAWRPAAGAPRGCPQRTIRVREVREGLEQLLRVGMLRRAEEAGGFVLLGHAAAVHDDDPITDLRHDAEVVGHEDDGHSEVAGDALEQLEDLRLDHHVECGRRLVGDDDVGVARERQGDHRALPHPAGVRVGVLLRSPPADPDPLEKLLGAPRTLGFAGARCVQADRLRDLVAHRPHRVQRVHRTLEDERQPRPAECAQGACRPGPAGPRRRTTRSPRRCGRRAAADA